jgi:tetratricopeptide (TPR) repeat protein
MATPVGTAIPPIPPLSIPRDDLITHVLNRLDETGRLALTGLPGVGKSYLARAIVSRSSGSPVFWAAAGTPETLRRDFEEFARFLGLPASSLPDPSLVVPAVLHWLEQTRHWLLVFDNVGDLSALDEFLPASGHGSILLTTRQRETASYGEPVEVPPLDETTAQRFLLERAQRIRHDQPLDAATPREREAALALAREFGGLPLALDQAGAFLAGTPLSLAEYLTLYRREGRLLRERRSCPSPTHDTVHATYRVALDRVARESPDAAALLTPLSLLAPDAIPEEIFPAAASQPLEWRKALACLERYSLLRHDPNAHLLSIHPVTQAVVRDTLTKSGQAQHARLLINQVARLSVRPAPGNRLQTERLLPQQLALATWVEQGIASDAAAAWMVACAGNCLAARSDYRAAARWLELALQLHQQIFGPLHLAVRQSLNDLAIVYQHIAPHKAEPLFERARALAEGSGDERAAAVLLTNTALTRAKLGRYRDAESAFEQALSVFRRTDGLRSDAVANVLYNLSSTLKELGRSAGARRAILRTLAIRLRLHGSDHPHTLDALNTLAVLKREANELQHAAALFEKILAKRQQQLDPRHLDVANSLANLGSVYIELNRLDDAEPLLLRALDICEERVGVIHPNTASCCAALCELYTRRKLFARAEEFGWRALNARQQVLGRHHPDVAVSLNSLACLLAQQHRWNEAEPLALRALGIIDTALGVDHPRARVIAANVLSIQRARAARA